MTDAAREPRLDAEDVRLWTMWQRAAMIHASTANFRRRVDGAKRAVAEALRVERDLAVMWSGGKDSTAMTHLACVASGAPLCVYSEKDDLDYPGERDYVERLAKAWGLDLRVLEPPISPRAWIAAHAHELRADGDMHSRAAGLSKACFYGVVETAGRQHGGRMIGLRTEESRGRRMNRATRGLLYRDAGGSWVSTPIADWTGLDVMAYLASNAIEPLPVYRCIGLDPEHAARPWLVRKSWWIPGAHARTGAIAWLRHYWPSLYRQLRAWISDASLHT